MKAIGITGEIGAGKSSCAGILSRWGAKVIDVDNLAKQVIANNKKFLQAVKNAFAEELLDQEGNLLTNKLKKIIEENPKVLDLISQYIHPEVVGLIKERLSFFENEGEHLVVIDAPLLIEVGIKKIVDFTIVVIADPHTREKRLQKGKRISIELYRILSDRQFKREEKMKHADVIIDNSGDLMELEEKLKRVWEEIKEE